MLRSIPTRSRGLFLGASFDGSILQVDGMANAAYYRSVGPGQTATVPPSALQLVQLLASYVTATVSPVEATAEAAPTFAFERPALPSSQPPTLAQQYATQESDVIRGQLSKTSPQLFERLDPTWRAYLALPAEVFTQSSQPNVEGAGSLFAALRASPTKPPVSGIDVDAGISVNLRPAQALPKYFEQ